LHKFQVLGKIKQTHDEGKKYSEAIHGGKEAIKEREKPIIEKFVFIRIGLFPF